MHRRERIGAEGRPGRDKAARVDRMVVRHGRGVGLQTLVTEVVRVVGGADAGARIVRMLQLDEGRLGRVDQRAAAVHLLVQRSRRPVHVQVLLVVRVLTLQRISGRHPPAGDDGTPSCQNDKEIISCVNRWAHILRERSNSRRCT